MPLLARRLIQRAVSRRVGHRPAVFIRHFLLFRGTSGGRPLHSFSRGIMCNNVALHTLSVTCGDSSPEGGAKPYPHQHPRKDGLASTPWERWQRHKPLTERGVGGAASR